VASRANFRAEFEFWAENDNKSRIGLLWHGQDSDSDNVFDDAYVFYLDDVRKDDSKDTKDYGKENSYTLIKRVAGVDNVVASGSWKTSDATWMSTENPGYDAVHKKYPYRFRIDYYCGYVRIQIQSAPTGSRSPTGSMTP